MKPEHWVKKVNKKKVLENTLHSAIKEANYKTIQHFADTCGVSKSCVMSIIHNQRKTVRDVCKILMTLDCRFEDIWRLM